MRLLGSPSSFRVVCTVGVQACWTSATAIWGAGDGDNDHHGDCGYGDHGDVGDGDNHYGDGVNDHHSDGKVGGGVNRHNECFGDSDNDDA